MFRANKGHLGTLKEGVKEVLFEVLRENTMRLLGLRSFRDGRKGLNNEVKAPLSRIRDRFQRYS